MGASGSSSVAVAVEVGAGFLSGVCEAMLAGRAKDIQGKNIAARMPGLKVMNSSGKKIGAHPRILIRDGWPGVAVTETCTPTLPGVARRHTYLHLVFPIL